MPDMTLPYLCFSIDHDRREAQRTFYDRYGVLPTYTFEHSRMLWLGPVPQEQASPEKAASDD